MNNYKSNNSDNSFNNNPKDNLDSDILNAIVIGTNNSHINELRELLVNCQVNPVNQIRIKNINYKYYLNPNYFEKTKKLIKTKNINLIVIDDNLNVSQERNLEKMFDISVIDRTAVILDIFALHAKTKFGQLQVELAQLKYNYARLTGLWTHLEKLQGGIGSRGPGESQLETDKRLINKQIFNLEKRLKKYDNALETSKKERNNSLLFQVSLVGYTNSGKSALFNKLANSNSAKVKNELFVTLDPLTRKAETDNSVYLVNDTVGFIRKLPHQLINAFNSTLNIINDSNLLLEVYDVNKSIKVLNEEQQIIEDTLIELKVNNIKRIKIFNKIDLISNNKLNQIKKLYPEAIYTSCLDNNYIEINNYIDKVIKNNNINKDIVLNYKDYNTLHLLYEIKAVKSCENLEDGLKLHLNISKENYNRFLKNN